MMGDLNALKVGQKFVFFLCFWSLSPTFASSFPPVRYSAAIKARLIRRGGGENTKSSTGHKRYHIEGDFSTSSTSDSLSENSSSTPDKIVPRGGGGKALVSPPPPPTLRQYVKFAIPCLGLWIAQPLLSLVDTSFVGLSSGAAGSVRQLAALGPATTFFDGATYLFAFLNVATTNLYSSSEQGSDRAESVVRTSAKVAIRCGLGIMLFLFLFTRPLLSLYIGDQAASTPGLIDAATDYVRIRALSLPSSLLLGVVQAALLGAKDSVTPLIAIVYCTVVNVLGDYILVNQLHWGLQGAAIATTLAQWAATAALIPKATRTLLRNHNLFRSDTPVGTETVTGKAFLGFAAPVLTLILGKLAVFGFMTHTAAAVPGQPTPLAVHQIILSMLFFCAPFLEVLSQTAQTFLPPYLAPIRKMSPEQAEPWKQTSQKVATNLLGIGLLASAGVASFASLVPAYFGNWVTTDPTVQSALKPMAKYLFAGAFVWAPVAVSEGVLLARLELNFLAGVYMLSTLLLPTAFLRIKAAGGTIQQVWAFFGYFQLFRAITFTSRIWGGYALRKKSRAAAKEASSRTA